MDKKDYKLAYDYIYNLLNLDEESMKWPLTIDSMSIFKELVDEKLNNPTIEQVKQEWEAKDYIWEENEYDIKLISKKPTYYLKIRIFKKEKIYQGIITFEEHQLLTKTIKALRSDEQCHQK